MSDVVNSLFPPKLHVLTRSLSKSSIRSRASSINPLTPRSQDSSSRPCTPSDKPPLAEILHEVVDYLDARDMLSLSATSRHFGDLRTPESYQRHLRANGWDMDALLRRTDMLKGSTSRNSWTVLARSALYKDDIAANYASLPKEGEKDSSSTSRHKRAVERFFHALVDVATEHDQNNFYTLESIAEQWGLNLIRFVSSVRAHDWKMRYRKTFVIAAFINSQPPQPVVASDIDELAESLVFYNPKARLSFIATRANFLYLYSSTIKAPPPLKPVPCTAYDPPHVHTLHGTALPGVQNALERFKQRIRVRGFYQKVGGDMTWLTMAFEPRGLASRSKLPFTEKSMLTLTATVTDEDGNEPWEIDGSFDRKTGVGKLRNPGGQLCYEMWITPWGVMGEKTRTTEGKHLGYFVLHWD